ncbi:hypothetical protein IT418_02140 [bacterium]|nr:hypothetical protein [bacterium]
MIQELFKEFSMYWHVKAVRTMFWVRFLAYFLIYLSPFWGMVLAIYLDTWDWDYLQKYKVSSKWYHRIDKVVDYLEYLVIIPLVIGTPIAELYLLFLAWRTMGMILYFFAEMNSKLFVIFPNMAEYLALLYFASETFGFGWNVTHWQWLLGLLIYKLVFELQFHYFQVGLPITGAKQSKLAQMYAKFNQKLIP